MKPRPTSPRAAPALFGAAGTMVSTVSDLADYARMLGRGDLLKPETCASAGCTRARRPGLR
ncbi:hypothetical protein ACWEKR_15475 [Nocardia sp. NPDC004573]